MPDPLLVGCAMTGLSPEHLWELYLDTGGGSPLAAVATRLAGDRSWPEAEELALAVTVHQELHRLGVPTPALHPALQWAVPTGPHRTVDTPAPFTD